MTRYTNKKHGLVLGWSNYFFWFGPDQCKGSFPAIVWAKGYNFTQVNPYNFDLKTPAHQLMWETTKELIVEDVNGKPYEHYITAHRPNRYLRGWLDANTPGWTTPPITSNEQQPTYFFTKRKHALAFIAFIEEQLDGMKFEEV